ncbi:MAG: 3D domain-containing protein [Patescibacteria group bacterium]|jgi:3D (Asp-Asp-Asp) domain-containing protein|nr:3D domain-containing protein [Patescibacteria group bacterium]
MRLVSTLIVARLLLIIALPAFAMESNSIETLTETKIKNQEIVEVYEKERLATFSDSILTNQSEPSRESLSVFNAKIKGYSSTKTANEAVYGKKMDILVTGYSSTPDQCWGNPFITASGARVHVGTMACPPEYAFGTKIEIDGMGTYVCEDRGGAIKGSHFDMWFESRGEALQWGKRTVEARIIE